jgi:2-C-methyl-D-erythritol 4-phosphate cytidylyltransferase
MASIGVIIPAAGRGKRFGGGLPKQYHLLRNEPIIVHSVRTALAVKGVLAVVIAVAHEDELCAKVLQDAGVIDERLHIITGGSERQHSIQNALNCEALLAPDVILVHDGVRPLATANLFSRVADGCIEHAAVIPVMPVVDTIKRVDGNGTVIETVPRGDLRRVQTPQAFRAADIRSAYRSASAAGTFGTDDASLIEAYGSTVHTVIGEEWNIKVTSPVDLILAESLFSQK